MPITMKQLKVSAEFPKKKLDIPVLSNDRIRDYFRTADSGLFLRRAGDFGSHDSRKNARET